ncbi:MAG: sensor histidine kinase [Rhizobiaceae bacterium]|nr:sensor histidine kinase [Rhizobiaceae bacterium]
MQRGFERHGTDPGLSRALSHTGVFVVLLDSSARIEWSVNVPASWRSEASPDGGARQLLDGDAGQSLEAAVELVRTSGEACKLDIPVAAADGIDWYTVWVDTHVAEREDGPGIMITGMDVTERKHREQTLRTLLREVAHRSKNLLAIIQSIATQTGRHADSVDGFLTRFRGRIQSMASTQDLVTSSNWRGADIHELAHSQIGRYVADPSVSIRLSGERPYLNPNAALHVGLAFHELAVNSVSFGALAAPEGHVSINLAHRVPQPEGDLTLEWWENIPGSNVELRPKRFGSTALERVVPAALGGTADLAFSAGRLTYRLAIPHLNFASG